TLAGVIVGRSSVGGYPNRCCPHPSGRRRGPPSATPGRPRHRMVPHARAAGPAAVATGIGITNALAEETLWRGAPAETFPADPRCRPRPQQTPPPAAPLGDGLCPAVGFTAWHLVPRVHSADHRAASSMVMR